VNTEKPGNYQGKHFPAYTGIVSGYKKAGKFEEAKELLLHLVDATEAESLKDGRGVAPWYYEELAKIYRKQRNYSKEVEILERFKIKKHAPGVTPPILIARLEKAKELLKKSEG
jgi:pentatricopeptide repeat protein